MRGATITIPGRPSDAGPLNAAAALAARISAHREGIEFLRAAAEAVDQAEACFRDAGTDGDIDLRGWNHRISLRNVNEAFSRMLKEAEAAIPVDDSGEPSYEADAEVEA
jgi:hypothetical protein